MLDTIKSHDKVRADGYPLLHADIVLSKRETEALQWAAEGKSEWEIGVILGVSEHTSEKFIRSACAKLHAVNRTQAVARAIRMKLIP